MHMPPSRPPERSATCPPSGASPKRPASRRAFSDSHPEFRDQILRMRSTNTPTRSLSPTELATRRPSQPPTESSSSSVAASAPPTRTRPKPRRSPTSHRARRVLSSTKFRTRRRVQCAKSVRTSARQPVFLLREPGARAAVSKHVEERGESSTSSPVMSGRRATRPPTRVLFATPVPNRSTRSVAATSIGGGRLHERSQHGDSSHGDHPGHGSGGIDRAARAAGKSGLRRCVRCTTASRARQWTRRVEQWSRVADGACALPAPRRRSAWRWSFSRQPPPIRGTIPRRRWYCVRHFGRGRGDRCHRRVRYAGGGGCSVVRPG